MRYDRNILAAFIFTLVGVVGFSQEVYYEHYTGADGLPSMTTYEMVQDSNGVLWVGTENGLVSYDGENFERYSHPELMDNDIIEIALDKTGRIFFANLSHQLAYVENETVNMVNIDSIQGKILNIITTDKANYVTVQINQENLQYYSNKNSDLNTETTMLNLTFSDTGNGKFQFELSNAYYFLHRNNKFTSYKRESSTRYISDHDTLDVFVVFENKKRFYSTADNRHFHFNFIRILIEFEGAVQSVVGENILSRVIDAGNSNFIILPKETYFYDKKSRKKHSILKGRSINTAFVDRESNVWLSSPSDGLYKIPHFNFQFESEFNNIADGFGISDFLLDDSGNSYIGTANGLVFIYSKERNLLKNYNVSNDPVTFLKYNNKIYGISEPVIFSIDPSTKILKNLRDKGVFNIKCFLLDDDTAYIGSRWGYFKTDIRKISELLSPPGEKKELTEFRINCFYKDNEKNLYVGTSSGLYKQNAFENSRHQEIENIKGNNISCLTSGMQNSIFVGTRTNGVYHLRGDSVISNYNRSNILSSNNVNDIKIRGNMILVSTLDGADIINTETDEINRINELQGFTSKEITVSDKVGDEYWFGTKSGLSIVKSEQLDYIKNHGPKLSIKSILANGVEIPYKDNLRFGSEINTIEINFRNISHRKGSKKEIKYKINSSDTSWVSSSDPLIRLQSLKHGKYEIEAFGITDEKNEGNKVAFSFIIFPPWWQTIWAITLGLILTIFVFRIFIRRRANRIRKEESVKRDYLIQINKIKDQALQLQMNPHFIFNSLNAIQGFIGTDDEELAMNYLARFARLIRLIFEHSKGNTITLEEELEFINLYLDLEKLRFKDKVEVKITIDDKLDDSKDVIPMPPLLIQPIVENSFKHGLFHKKEKGKLNIDYSLHQDMLQIVIQDDGIGRKEARKINQKNLEKYVSSGIKTTLERIDLLNFSSNTNNNKITIEDLYDASNKAVGTRTTLLLDFNNIVKPIV